MADHPASKRPGRTERPERPERTERPEHPEGRDRRDRRAPAGPPGSIRWMKGILGRPLTLLRRADGLQLALQERRRSPEVIQAESMARLREELRLRLLELDHQHATTVMRQLVFVHDVLGRQGWAGVQAMNSSVLRKATVQVQMLIEREPSRRLGRLADRLRTMQAAAGAREERIQGHASALAAGEALQVTELSPEEFEASQREWEATAPAPLDPGAQSALADPETQLAPTQPVRSSD